MIIEAAIYAQLMADTAGFVALTSGNLMYNIMPQDTTNPYVVLSKISGIRDAVMEGHSGLVEGHVQFSIFAATYLLCKQIAAAIQADIEGFKGVMGGTGGVNVNGCYYDNEVDLGFEHETNLYGLAIDYHLWYQE